MPEPRISDDQLAELCPNIYEHGEKWPEHQEWVQADLMRKGWYDAPIMALAGAALLDLRDARERIALLETTLTSVATARQEADDSDHPDFDWRLLAERMESIARRCALNAES